MWLRGRYDTTLEAEWRGYCVVRVWTEKKQNTHTHTKQAVWGGGRDDTRMFTLHIEYTSSGCTLFAR